MNTSDFDDVLSNRIEKIQQVLGNKAKEYAADGDRLYNFKMAAQADNTTPERALWGMFLKHWVSVKDLVDGKLPATEYLINEKIGDAINYLILLEAIFMEKGGYTF